MPVSDPVALVEAVALEESDTLGVTDAEAPTVTDAVGVREIDAARVSELEGVANADPEGVGDGLPVPETVGVILDVIEDESEMVPELEGLAPRVRLAVGDLDCDLERLCVELAVADDVGVLEVVIEAVPVCEEVAVGVFEAESEFVGVGDDERDGDGVPLAEPPIDSVVVGDAVTVVERLNVDDPLPLPDGVRVGVWEPDPVPEFVGELVAVTLDETVDVALAESEMLGVTEGLAPSVTEGVAEFDSDALIVAVVDGVHEDVPVQEEVPDPEDVCEGVSGGVIEAVIDAVDVGDDDSESGGVPLAEPPIDRVVVGVAVTVAERVNVVDPLSLPDGVRVGVQEPDPDPDPVGVFVFVEVDDKVVVVELVPESEPVFDELAPTVMDAVGVRDTDRERLVVELGVIDGVFVSELVGVPVVVALPDTLADVLGVSEILDVTLALAPLEIEGVAEVESDALREDVDEGVIDDVTVPDGVPEPEPVWVGVGGGVILADTEADDVGDGVTQDVGVPLAEPPADSVVVGVIVMVVVWLVVVEPLSLLVGVGDGVGEPVPVPELVGDTECDGVVERVCVVEPVPVSDPVFDELTPDDSDAVGVFVMDRDKLLVELGVIDGVPVSELVGDFVGLPLGVKLSETLDVAETLDATLAGAPADKVDVGDDGINMFDPDAVNDILSEVVREPDPVALLDGVCEGDDDSSAENALGVDPPLIATEGTPGCDVDAGEGTTEPVSAPLSASRLVDVPLSVAFGVVDTDKVSDGVPDAEEMADGTCDDVPELDVVGSVLTLSVPLHVADGDWEDEGVGVGEGDDVRDPDSSGSVPLGVPLDEPLGVLLDEPDAVTVGEIELDGLTVALGVGGAHAVLGPLSIARTTS